jgi:Big-like domain-containing protein/pectate lyase-like protein
MSLKASRATLALSVMVLFIAPSSPAGAVAPGGSAPAAVSAAKPKKKPKLKPGCHRVRVKVKTRKPRYRVVCRKPAPPSPAGPTAPVNPTIPGGGAAGEDGVTPPCSAADFGAKGDGRTDDRAALQRAIDQCAVVHVPAGRYLVSPQGGAAFDLNVPAGRSIVGDDRETTTFVQTVAGPSVRLLHVSGGGVTITGLTLDGNKAVQTVDEHRAGVFAVGAPNLVLRNVKAQNFTGDGFYIYAGSDNATIDNVIGIDNDRNGITFGGGTTGGSVTDSTFSGNAAQQLDSEPGLGGTVNGLTVTGSRFDSSNDYAVTMSGSSSNSRSTGWTVKNNVINGGVFAVWLTNSEISGNRGTNSSTKPCYTVYRTSADIAISDNDCVQTQTSKDSVAGVLVQGTGPGSMPTNITVAANRIQVTGRATSFGVRAEGAASVSITGNTLIGPGRAAAGHAGVYLRSTVVGSPLKSAIVDGNEIWSWSDSAFRLSGNRTPIGSAGVQTLEFKDNVLGDTSSPLVQLHAATIDADAVPVHQTRIGNSCIPPMSCANANMKTSVVSVSPVTGTYGTTHTIAVSGTQDGGPLNGTVLVQAGPVEAGVAVVNGTGTFTTPADLPVGTYPVTATYAGTDDVNGATANGSLSVTKAATATTLKIARTKIKVNKSSKATVTVEVVGTAPPANGQVTIKAGGKTVGAGTVKNGNARITIRKFTRKGAYKLKATFTGSAYYSASTGKTVKLEVTK